MIWFMRFFSYDFTLFENLNEIFIFPCKSNKTFIELISVSVLNKQP